MAREFVVCLPAATFVGFVSGGTGILKSGRDLEEHDEVFAEFVDGRSVYSNKNLSVSEKMNLISRTTRDAEWITIRKLPNGEIMAFRSKEFYGKESPASQAAIDYVQNL